DIDAAVRFRFLFGAEMAFSCSRIFMGAPGFVDYTAYRSICQAAYRLHASSNNALRRSGTHVPSSCGLLLCR
ncbi:hypothetical protein, partial [Burkholderia sp. BCCCDS02]